MLLLEAIKPGQNRLRLFNPLYASSKGKWVSLFLKTMPFEIGFPMTLTSGAFVNKKRNKQTSHELQSNLDSSCISFCTPSRKRRFKTSQDETKLPDKTLSAPAISKQVSRHCINFPHELTCQILTNQNIKIGRRAWSTRDSEKSQKRLPSLHVNVKAGWIFASEVSSKSTF